MADYAILARRPRWVVIGFFDEPAHLATGLLVLLNLRPRSRAWAAGLLAGSLLPDVDHVPLALAPEPPALDDPRPRSHCLAALAPLVALGLALEGPPGEACAGAAAGGLAHFARDLAIGPGAPLLWPLSSRDVTAPYPLYAAMVAFLAGRANLGGGL